MEYIMNPPAKHGQKEAENKNSVWLELCCERIQRMTLFFGKNDFQVVHQVVLEIIRGIFEDVWV